MVNNRTSRAGHSVTGYRNPPAATRFRKGQSGNPAGKPKGARNKPRREGERLRSLMLEEAYRPVTVNDEGGGKITLPMAQAVLRSLAAAAAKGEARAQAMFLKLVSTSEHEEAAIEETLELAREEAQAKAAADELIEIECHIVDEKGRPTGEVYGERDGKFEKISDEIPSRR